MIPPTYTIENIFFNSSLVEEHSQRFPQTEIVLNSDSSSSSGNVFLIGKTSINRTTSLNIQEYSYEFSLLYKKAAWFEDFSKNASTFTDVKSILPYYKKIDDLLINSDFNTCDALLNNINTKNLSDVLLIGLLRLTYSWKAKLPSWPLLLSKTSKELSLRGYDDKKLLRGLM